MSLPEPPDGMVEVGRISGVFGIRGEVRLFLHHRESTWLQTRRRVQLVLPDSRREVWLRARRGAGNRIIGRIEDVESREEAHALIGARLWVPRSALPKLQDDEFYIQDVVGAEVIEGDQVAGRVNAVHLAGPVEILEVRVADGVAYLPCVRERILSIDPGRVVVAPGALVPDEPS